MTSTDQPDIEPSDDLLMEAWGLIANAYDGNWPDGEWTDAAIRWRDKWHARLDADALVVLHTAPSTREARADAIEAAARQAVADDWLPDHYRECKCTSCALRAALEAS